ncbi:helix-turn-helix transcriptional regulator, partial [Veillonella atypica]
KFYISELRARKGATQAQVAADLGISVATYNAWEKDISNVAISKVVALAEYFGCTVDQIFLTRNLN